MERHFQRIFRFYFLAVSVWIFLYLIANNKADWDLWGVMSFGALLDQNPNHFPYSDPFSYTAFGKPWVYHEWGSGVVFFQLFKHFGSPALFWLKFLLVEGIFLLACQGFLRKRPEGNPAPVSILFPVCLVIAAYLILPIVSTTIRCQLFTFFGYALFLFILERHRHTPSWKGIWLLPLLMMGWVNLHGGFITGLFIIGTYLLAYWLQKNIQPTIQLAVVFALSSLSTLANPYGWVFLKTMIDAWSLPRTEISEWGNVFTLDIPAYGLLYSTLLIIGYSIGLWQWRNNAKCFSGTVLLLVFSGLYGWLHYKLTPLFLITLLSVGFQVLPPAGTIRIPEKLKNFGKNLYPLYAYLTPALLTLLGLGTLALYLQTHSQPLAVQVQGADTIRQNKALTRFAYPVGAATFLQENQTRCNLWVPFAWGEFLYWTLYPHCRISIDGRYETIYPQSVFEAYYAFYHPPYQIDYARQYGSTHILVPARQSELAQKLISEAKWHLLYQDNLAILLSRSPGQNQAGQPYSTASTTLDQFRGNLNRFQIIKIPGH
jgi:hypothetical protein